MTPRATLPLAALGALAALASTAPLGCAEPGDDDSAPDVVDCSERPLDQPSPRGEVAGVWDAPRGRFVVFGGDEGTPIECTSQPDFVGQTWAFHADCDSFERLAPDDAPHRRGRHAAALDAAGARMLVHGGRFRELEDSRYTLFDDVWAFDLETDQWSFVAEGGPEARSNHVAVVAGDLLVVYGGSTSDDGASFDPKEDVWTLDLVDGAWTEVDAGAGPGERLFHAGAVSDDGRTLYVYGGGDENAFFGPFFGDLWALDLEQWTWSLLDDGEGDAPAARIWANLVHDGPRDRLLLFGGHDDGALGNTNELWAYSLSDGRWERLREGDALAGSAAGFCDFPADFVEPDLESPERRNASAAALTDGGDLLVFGGKTDCGLINDVWTWSLAEEGWTRRARATAGEICLRAYAECSTMCF